MNPYFLLYFLVFVLFVWSSLTLWMNRERTFHKWAATRLSELPFKVPAKSKYCGFYDEASEARVWWYAPGLFLKAIAVVFFPVVVFTGCISTLLILYKYEHIGFLVLLGIEIAILAGAYFGQFEIFKLYFATWSTGALLFTWNGWMLNTRVTYPGLFGPGKIFMDCLEFNPTDSRAIRTAADVQTIDPHTETGMLHEWYISWVLLPRHIMALSVESFVATTKKMILWMHPRAFEDVFAKVKSSRRALDTLRDELNKFRAKQILGEPGDDENTYDLDKAEGLNEIAVKRLEEITGENIELMPSWFLLLPHGVPIREPDLMTQARDAVLHPAPPPSTMTYV